MAVYSQLLVNTGGGIIDRNQQSDRQEGATVAIGIGGTGLDALMNLKKKVHRNLKPDDKNSPVKEYKHIRYLAIDSDATKIPDKNSQADLDKNTEFVDISHGDIAAALGAKKVLENKKELDWFRYEDITIGTARSGAGGIRQIGRFLLFENAANLRSKIKDTITGARTGANVGLNIHIFAGLSGGTGSGCFLDVCYLVRDILSELGITGQTRVCGYFFLPDVNLSVQDVGGNSLISSYVKVNGYAALQELDYLMGIGDNGERFLQNYGTFRVDSEEKPVDQCFLVSTTDTSGKILDGGYTYAMNVVTDFVLSFLSKVTLPAGVTAGQKDGGLTLEGLFPNLDAAKGGITKSHGASYDYNILGSSNAEIPLTEITTYLGAKLFEQWAEIYDKVPLENDLTAFVSKTNTGFEQIMSSLTRGIDWKIPFPDYDPKTLIAGNGPAVEKADDWLSNVSGKLEENRKNLGEPLGKDTYQIPGNTTSLTGSVYKALYDTYSIHLDKGPFFAMRLLGGKDNKNLLHVIDGYIERNKQLLEAENRQNTLRKKEYDNALEKMRAASLGNRRNRCKEYLHQLELLYQHNGKIKQYKAMDDLLNTWRKQIVELNNNFFDVLTTVLDTLKDTFRENAKILTEGVRKENTYTWEILSVPDIKATLDEEVARLDADQVLHSFMDKMFAEFPRWMNQNEDRIAGMVTEFVLDEFGSASRKTITDYLRVKFQTSNPAALSKKIEDEILVGVLENRSEPLFWKNPTFQMTDVVRKSVLSVPNDAADIVNAADDFVNNRSEFSVRRTGLGDRMSMLRFYVGMPLYAYQGLRDLESAYEADAKPGRHLYEKGEKDWNKILPSPIPASFQISGHDVERINNRNQELKDELARAEQEGIVTRDASGLTVHRSAPLDLKGLLDGMGEYRNGGQVDLAKLQAVIKALCGEKGKMYQANTSDVKIKVSKATDVDQVLMDDYLRYPAISKMVREELEKMAVLTAEIEEKERELEEERERQEQKRRFFNALFTGTLIWRPTKIVYHYTEYGIEQETDLQDAAMPYADCQAYQAWLTYQALDQGLRTQIDAEAAERMNNMDSEIYGKAKTVEQKHTSELLKLYLSSAEGKEDYESVKQFYQELMQALQRHIIMYQ